MKYSIYNNYIVLTPQYRLLYNSFTNMYVLMKDKMANAFLSQSLRVIEEEYPKFFLKLQEAGCIIEDEVDEVGRLQERIRDVDNQKSHYALTVNPTMNCNFKCWYCYENHIAHSRMSAVILESTKKHITLIITTTKLEKFHLGFFGGEPLLYYEDIVRPLINHLLCECKINNLPYSISFTTNGYLLTDKIIKEFESFKVTSLQITLDGGKDEHNKVRYPYKGADSYTRIVSNIKKLLRVGISVVLRINYTTANLASVKTIVTDFQSLSENEKKYLQVDLHRVWQDSENKTVIDTDLLEECYHSFEEKGIKVSAPIMNQVWASCYADKKQQALINYNGDVYKCTARDFNDNNRLGILNADGTITWNEEKMKQREGIRLSKKVCQGCRISPICGSTCTQRILDKENADVCIRGLDDVGKDKVVLNQFYYSIIKNEISI